RPVGRSGARRPVDAGDDRPLPRAWTLCGLDRRRRGPLYLFGLRSLHRGRGARSRTEARAQAKSGDDRAGRAARSPHRPLLDLSADSAGDARRIGLLAAFPPTLQSMPAEFQSTVTLVPKLVEGAMAPLDRGDRAGHDPL